MMIRLGMIACFLLMSAPAFGASRLVVGVEEDYPPYAFRSETGQATGFNVALTRAIAEVMGLDVKVRMAPWAEIRTALENGEIDAVAGMYYSKERDHRVDFSTPYTIVHHTAIIRSNTPFPTSEGALKHKTLIVMRGDIMHDYVVEKGLSRDVVETSSQADALRLLASGNGAYALVARLPALFWIQKLGLSHLRETGLQLRPSSYCFAVTEGDVELLSRFTEGLAILKKTGRYQELYDQWLGVLEPESRTLERILLVALAAVVVLVLLLAVHFVWVRTLRRQVCRKTETLNREVETRKQAEKHLDHTNRILTAILSVSQAIAREKDVGRLSRQTCRYLTRTGGYHSAWIAWLSLDGKISHTFEADLGEHSHALFDALDQGKVPACMRRALETDKVVVEERPSKNCPGCPLASVYGAKGAMTVRLHRDGRTFGVLSVSMPVRFLEDNDELALLAQVSSDLALAVHELEIKEEQARLQKSLARANIIVENSPIILFRWKAREGWPVEFVSRNIRNYGYSVEDFLSGDVEYRSIIHPDDLGRVVREVFEKTNSGTSQFVQEYRIFDKLGKVHWIEDRTTVDTDDQGVVRSYQGVVFDISQRKEAEETLRQSEERFRLLVEQASDAFFLFDTGGRFLDVNQSACESLGYDRGELLDSSVDRIDTEFSIKRVRDVLHALEPGQNLSVSGTHLRKDGSRFPVEVRVSCFHWKGETVYLGLARDISERRKAEEERERLIQRLQEALSEVRTLKGLIPICSHCKSIRDDQGYWGQIESYLAEHSDMEFSHSICPECAERLYPDMDLYGLPHHPEDADPGR